MDVIVTKDYTELSQKAADIIQEQVNLEPESVLGLATGGSPKGTYEELIQRYKKGQVDFSSASAINLDEYVGIDNHHPQSYQTFMKEQLFDQINIDRQNAHIPDGKATDLQEECARYEKLIEDIGPPHLQLLGIGQNGHIGFNEPGSSFESETHVVQLAESTREANARFFSSIEEVPREAVTMGIRSIMKSKKVLLIASGASKAEAIKQLLSGDVQEDFPASALHDHPNVTLIVDLPAYAGVEKE